MTDETIKNLEKISQNCIETIHILSENEVIDNCYEEKQCNDVLKDLQIEMKLRGLSKQTSKTYLFYNIKDFLAYKLSDDPVSNGSINLIKASLKFYYSEIIGKNIFILNKTEIKQLLDKTKNIKTFDRIIIFDWYDIIRVSKSV